MAPFEVRRRVRGDGTEVVRDRSTARIV